MKTAQLVAPLLAALAFAAAGTANAQRVTVCDPVLGVTNCIKPNSNGSINIAGSFTASTTATASTTPPTYTAGPQQLSMDLAGNLRVGDFNWGTIGTYSITSGGTGAYGLLEDLIAAAENTSTVPTKAKDSAGNDATDTTLHANRVSIVGGLPVSALASVPISIATATTTQLVAAVSGKAIYVTAFDFLAAGTDAVTLEYGTGTACGTGTTALTGAYPLIAQVGLSANGGGSPKLFVPTGNALCVVTSAAVQLSGSLTDAQQ